MKLKTNSTTVWTGSKPTLALIFLGLLCIDNNVHSQKTVKDMGQSLFVFFENRKNCEIFNSESDSLSKKRLLMANDSNIIQLHKQYLLAEESYSGGLSAIQSSEQKLKKGQETRLDAKSETPILFTPVIGIKTNLIYWVGISPELKYRKPIPNLELEYYFKKRWSVNVDGSYTFQDNSYKMPIWDVTCVSVEPRVWLKNDAQYKGFFGGVYCLLGDYDTKKRTAADGHTGGIFEGGISLGYHLSLYSRIGLEVGARAGFRSLNYDTYCINNRHSYFIENFTVNGVKLTTLRILLTYRFGGNNKD